MSMGDTSLFNVRYSLYFLSVDSPKLDSHRSI